MIQIKEGKTYTASNSDIAITIIKIMYKSHDYIKMKIRVFNKYNGIVYHSLVKYTVPLNNMGHWVEL